MTGISYLSTVEVEPFFQCTSEVSQLVRELRKKIDSLLFLLGAVLIALCYSAMGKARRRKQELRQEVRMDGSFHV